jgi:hypothetical protein
MFKAQSGKCAICGKRKPLGVDHCHVTGKIRKLICIKCNTGIGMFGDSPVLIKKALEYLK